MILRFLENLVAWAIILGFLLWLVASCALERAEDVLDRLS